MGAQRALAALSHELSSPLTALHTFLRLAKGDGLERIDACAQRIQSAVELARELSRLPEPHVDDATDLVLAFESAASRLAVPLTIDAAGPMVARVAPPRAVAIASALLRGVASSVRVDRRGDRIWVRVNPELEPTKWRVIEPWVSGTGYKLDLWAAAVMAGDGAEVRVGDRDGQICVELELEAR